MARKARGIATWTAAIAAALVLTACGSYSTKDDDAATTVPTGTATTAAILPPVATTPDAGPSPLTRAQFVSLANQVCQAANQKLANFYVTVQVSGVDPARVADLLYQAADQGDKAAETLGTLSPPAGDEAFAQRLEAKRAELTETIRRLGDAYLAGDPVAVQTESANLNRTGTEMKQMAAEYGMSKC